MRKFGDVVKRLSFIALILLAGSAWAQSHTQVAVRDTQTITGDKTLDGTLAATNGAQLSGTVSGNPSPTDSITLSLPNGVYNAAACLSSPQPSWCAGARDIGAAINSAYAAGGSGGVDVYIPAGSHPFTTPILAATAHKSLHLYGAGVNATKLVFNGGSGTTAITIDTGTSSYTSELSRFLLIGPGNGTSTTGIACGSSANDGSIFSEYDLIQVTAFGTGLNFGWNCFGWQGNQITVSNNNQDVLDGASAKENMSCFKCIISLDIPGTTGTTANGLQISTGSDWHLYSSSIDNVQLAVSGNATVHMYGGHMENPALGSYDFFTSSGNSLEFHGTTFNQDNSSSFANGRFGSITGGSFNIFGGTAFSPIHLKEFVGFSGTAYGSDHGLILNSNFSSGWEANTGSGATAAFPQDNAGNAVTTGVVQANSLRGAVLEQISAKNFAGSCRMSSGTSCTFTTTATFSHYLSFVSIDQASAPPASAISAKCAINRTTVTITAGASNSLTWDCLLVGNPN
jgi:hypothetical protein